MDYNAEFLKLDVASDGRETLPRHATQTWEKRDPAALLGVVYHQSLENYGTASGNAKYHVGPNHVSADGLPGLSYTAFVEKKGNVVLANDIEDKTFSQGDRKIAGDENALYLGICFGGNFSGPGYEGPQEPTAAQLDIAQTLWHHLQGIFGFTNNQLFGHYDFGKPTCPGNALMEIIEAINSDKDWKDPKFDLGSVGGRQCALRSLGYYNGQIDGEWGIMSRTALISFQKAVDLMTDGVWGKQTNAAVSAALGE